MAMSLAPPDPSLIIQSLDVLPTRPIVWLWSGRLARGKLAIFDGDPGLGKSLVTLDLCARITTGRPFPDGSPAQGPANVLLFHGEDAAEDVVNPRLDSLAADRARVFHVHRRHDLGPEPLCFPTHLPLLDHTLEQVRPLMVVIDPIMAFLDRTISTGNDPSVRRVLNPLAQYAEKYDCAVILVRHLNKNAGFARHPAKPAQSVLAQVKNNLAPPQPSLAYELLPRRDDVPELRWCGPCDLSAADLLKWADRAYPARFRAREFLLNFLQDGPKPCKLIWDAALKLGLSKKTLERAGKDVEIRTHRTIDGPRRIYYWFLKGHDPPLSSDPDVRAFEERLEQIRGQLPPRNALEE
jgi:hypothetical protein